MILQVLIVQHGDKDRLPGDPGLTALGHEQARTTARWLAETTAPVSIWSSPLRRARETAAALGNEVACDVTVDPRLRERMNWEGPEVESLDSFLAEWQRASTVRSYVPNRGESSMAAGERFIDALDEIAATHTDGAVVIVAHGGVTTDALRTLFGDDRLRRDAPAIIDDGVPCCAVTTLDHGDGGWTARSIASTAHLSDVSDHPPA